MSRRHKCLLLYHRDLSSPLLDGVTFIKRGKQWNSKTDHMSLSDLLTWWDGGWEGELLWSRATANWFRHWLRPLMTTHSTARAVLLRTSKTVWPPRGRSGRVFHHARSSCGDLCSCIIRMAGASPYHKHPVRGQRRETTPISLWGTITGTEWNLNIKYFP